MPLPLLGDGKLELLRDKISKAVRDSIAAGALKDGEQLVEATVAQKLGVSRAAVREAFWVLERQGHVRIVPHRGAFVRQPSGQELQDIFEILVTLEPLAAAGADPGVRNSGSPEWERILEEMRDRAKQGDQAGYFELELLFHQQIWRLGGNRKVEEVLCLICPALFTALAQDSRVTPEVLSARIAVHSGILAALAGGGPDTQALVRSAVERLNAAF